MYKFCRLLLIASVIALGYCGYAFGNRMGKGGMLFVGVVACVIVMRRKRFNFTSGGTARWATEDDLRQARMLDGRPGMIVGRVFASGRLPITAGLAAIVNPRIDSATACQKFLGAAFPKQGGLSPVVKLSSAVHTAVFAPTGVGKGVSCVVPFLLDCCADSAVVVDFKSELVRLTAERRRAMGHQIVILDPYQLVAGKDTFNPLDFIDGLSETCIDECRELAESQVIRAGQEKELHFLDSAEAWISAFAAGVAHYGDAEDRSLQTVRKMLNDPRSIQVMINRLCSSNAWDGMLARQGFQLTNFKDKELGSTLTTINRFTRYLDSPAIARSTSKSTFDPADLLRGKMTVYLVLPPQYARTQSPLLRMWIGGMLRAVVRGGLQEQKKVRFVLDEAASLGHMQQLDDAVDKGRGYGIRLHYFFQSCGQLKQCFPEGQEQTFLSNVTQTFFGVNDPQTAEYVSNRLGEETIIVESGGMSRGDSYQRAEGSAGSSGWSRTGNDNWGQQARKLLKPEEVMGLPARMAITFTPGVPRSAQGLPDITRKLNRNVKRLAMP